MKKTLLVGIIGLLALAGCTESQEKKDQKSAELQQSQYAASQPVPMYDWSLERHLVTELYNARNLRAVTHSVWRSNTGMIEGDCASIGFGIPFDTSLTNPLSAVKYASAGERYVVEQAEPNGIFASKNTSATWVMCSSETGTIEPVYIESKVTTYPYSVNVNYSTNRVIKSGKSSVIITVDG